MGKKLAFGCLGIFAVLTVVGGVLAYVYVLRPAGAAVDSARDLARLEALNDEVRHDAAFDAPADEALNASQVSRYLAVQRDVHDTLDERVQELEARYERFQEGGEEPGFFDMTRAWADMTSLLVEAKEAQVAALNAHGFSLDEYAWVRARVLHAAGVHAYAYDLTDVASRAENGEAASDALAAPEGAPPEANVTLVEPHLETLQDTVPLALFGL